MSKENFVRDSSGKATHIRVTSDDGRTSYLHKVEENPVRQLLSGVKGECVEVTEHHKNGTSDSYEADNSIIGQLFWGGKGKHK